MKIVSISESPAYEDDDGAIRADLTDIGKIINRIDHACRRNDALRAYIYALRDLQRAHDRYAIIGCDRVDQAKAAVAQAFDQLIIAEFTLNRSGEVLTDVEPA